MYKKIREFLATIGIMARAVISYVREKKLHPDSQRVHYDTLEENLFYTTYGEKPCYRVESNSPIGKKGFEVIENLSIEHIHSNVVYDQYGFYTKEIYYYTYNMDVSCLVKLTIKQSIPYEFTGDRLPTEEEAKYYRMATASMYGAIIVSTKFKLEHIESIVFVTDSELTDDVESTLRHLKQFSLQRANMAYVDKVGKELLS